MTAFVAVIGFIIRLAARALYAFLKKYIIRYLKIFVRRYLVATLKRRVITYISKKAKEKASDQLIKREVSKIFKSYIVKILKRMKEFMIAKLKKRANIIKFITSMNTIFLILFILLVLICAYSIKNKPMFSGLITYMHGVVAITVSKIIIYTLIFNLIYSFLDDFLIFEKIDKDLNFFSLYDSWKMFTEITVVAFIIDALLISVLPENTKKVEVNSKIDVTLRYDLENDDENYRSCQNLYSDPSKVYRITLDHKIKRDKRFTFYWADLIYGFCILRIIVNFFLYYIFSEKKIIVSRKITNQNVIFAIYIDLFVFIGLPFLLYLYFLLTQQKPILKEFIHDFLSIFKDFFRIFIFLFNSLKNLIYRCFKKIF